VATRLRSRTSSGTAALGPILVAGQWTLVPYLGLYLYERLGWPLEVAAGYLALAQVGGFVGRIGWGTVSDLLWHGRRKPALALICPVGAACAVALAILPVGAPAALVGLVAVVMGAAVIGWNGLFVAYVAEQAGAHRAGTALGLTTSVVFLGAVLYPPLFGWIVDRAGSYQPAWLLLAGLLVAGLGLFPFMREATRS
jgi:sugar phosphate permease